MNDIFLVAMCLSVYVFFGIAYISMRHRLNAIEEELSNLRHKVAISDFAQEKILKSPEFRLMKELSDAVDTAADDYKKRLVNNLKIDIGAK